MQNGYFYRGDIIKKGISKDELIGYIIEQGWDLTFVYNGQKSGLCSEVHDGIFSFEAWHGENIKEYGVVDVEVVISDPFFSGKSIIDLLDTVDFFFM